MTLERVMEIITEKTAYLGKIEWNYVQSQQFDKAKEARAMAQAIDDLFWKLVREEYGLDEDEK